jgi:regulator of protease activity HflC (stomatin/prohibitin superfamily)
MKKFLTMFVFVFGTLMSLTSCIGCTTVDADEESVLIDKPWFWGHGGVEETPVSTGLAWVWWSTSIETFKITPFKHQVDMNDLFSDDNTPLDFHTVIITQIKKGKTPILLQNYGVDWFNTNLYNEYCNLVRDHISQHSPFDLMSNRAILNDIDAKVLNSMRAFVDSLSKEAEFPVIIKQVTIGKATPNEKQLEEMNNTAKAVQAKQTQEREAEVQMAREKAERQRAIADKAYREELGLTIPQFIELRKWEVIDKKQGENIHVIVGGNSTPMIYNVK